MKNLKLVKWYLKGLKALWTSRNTSGYNSYSRWCRAEDGRKNGRHSSRMRGANDGL